MVGRVDQVLDLVVVRLTGTVNGTDRSVAGTILARKGPVLIEVEQDTIGLEFDWLTDAKLVLTELKRGG